MEEMKILSEFKNRFPRETNLMTDAEIIDTWKNTGTWAGLRLNLALNDFKKSLIGCFISQK